MVLQKIREKLTGILAGIFFAVLIIPFAFVGVNSYFTSDAVNAVAVVNEQEITLNDFNQSFQQYRRQMQGRLGLNFDAEGFDQPIVRRQHLDSMIDQKLLAQLSFEAGLSVADDVLASAIRDITAFQVGGEFNSDVYQASLSAQGMTPRQFENNRRSQMIMGQFPTAIATSAISTSWELDNYVRLHGQKRAFSAILVPSQFDDAAVIDEQAVVAWYDAHLDDYRSEEQIVIEYLELDSAVLGADVTPDEEQLRAQFEAQKTRFISPETRLASHILIEVSNQVPELEIESARQVAEDLVKRARAGEDFAALAKENSQDAGSAPEGGDLGWIEPGFMVQSFEDALYELTPEKPISEPVQTGFGWHVIYLRDIRPAEGMTFAEARPILLEEYQADQNERRFLEQADRLVDIIYEDPTTLDAASVELGLEIQTAGPFGRLGGEGIAANPAVVKASFSDLVMLQGVASDPVDLADNHLVVIRMKEYLPEARLPLDKVRDQVVQSIRRQRAMEAAQARADELLAQVTSGTDPSVVGAENELEVLVAEAATRTDTDIPQDLLRQLFLIKAPGEEGPVNEVLELTDGYAVVQLQSVSDGVLSAADVMTAQNYIRRITNATANNEAYGFMRMLRNQSEILVLEDRL